MPTEQDRENNMQHARRMAYDCMLKYGVNSVSYELLAENSGLGIRTLRRYFRNKVELVCDVMRTVGREQYHAVCEEMMAAIPADASGLEQLRKLYYIMFSFCGTDCSPWLMLSELELFAYENHLSSEILDQYLDEVNNSMKYGKAIILKGIEDGSIRSDIDPDAYTTLLSNTYIGMLQRMEIARYTQTDYSPASFKKQIDLHVETVISFMKKTAQQT